MKQPVEPSQEDCCHSDCNPCIFDVYQKQLVLYKKYLDDVEVATPVQNAISQLEYSEFLLVNSVEVCNDHKHLVFKQTSLDRNHGKVQWNPGDHFLVKYTNENKSCSRAYTPLKLGICNNDNDEFSESDFSIIVKKYSKGIVSNYLYNLQPGQFTLWRGPYGSYELKFNTFKHIVMIAQGTGVLPFISIIHNFLNNEEDMTRIILFYCCNNINDILFRDELYAYRCYWNFTYKIFLGLSSPNAIFKYLEPIMNHKLSNEDLSNLLPMTTGEQYLICGSTKFMEHYNNEILRLVPDVENIKLF